MNVEAKRNEAGLVPVRKAHEQIADQLVALMHAGELGPGARLPSEANLAREFKVSRATVREALRTLAARRLIETTRGARGGSVVASPTVADVSTDLRSSMDLLRQADRVSLDEFLEAREFLEIPAARLAALRHREADLHRLESAIPSSPVERDTDAEFGLHSSFHSIMLEICGNTLLYISAKPVFSVLERALARPNLDPEFSKAVDDQHRRILEAIRSKDPDQAADQMRAHLAFLRPAHERAWRRPEERGH